MNEKQQRNDDLQERLIEFAARVLDVVESFPIQYLPSLHHSLLDIRYSIWLRPIGRVGLFVVVIIHIALWY